MTRAERMSADNGIWLCRICHKLVDSDEERFPAHLLRAWKVIAEERTRTMQYGAASAPTAVLVPSHQLLYASLEPFPRGTAFRPDSMRLRVILYVIPADPRRIVIPAHTCEASVKVLGKPETEPMSFCYFHLGHERTWDEYTGERRAAILPKPATVIESGSDVLIDGPGTIEIVASCGLTTIDRDAKVELALTMGIVHSTMPMIVSGIMNPARTYEGRSAWYHTTAARSDTGL